MTMKNQNRRDKKEEEEIKREIDESHEFFTNPSQNKLNDLNNRIGRKLAVYENIGAIRVKGKPLIAARANKIVLNSIELLSDYETFIVDVVA